MTAGTRIAAGVTRPESVKILVDGRAIAAIPGESVATALLAAGIATLRHSPRRGTPRGPFCFMGICQECVVEIDGRLALSCQELVRAGLLIRLERNG
jgi:predicted molibdopterin-dependent oxidoreductase YjgC